MLTCFSIQPYIVLKKQRRFKEVFNCTNLYILGYVIRIVNIKFVKGRAKGLTPYFEGSRAPPHFILPQVFNPYEMHNF